MDIFGYFELSVTNCVQMALLVIPASLFLLWKRERQHWLTVDIVATLLFGLGFALCPSCLIDFEVVGKVDDASIVLTRLFGCALLGTAVVWILTRETLDGTVPITLMTARVFSCAVILMAQVYTHFISTKGKKDVHWSDQHVSFGMFGTLVWMLGNLLFLLRSHDFSSYPQYHVRINEFLRVDALFTLLLALLFFAFPELLIRHFYPDMKLPSCISTHMVRCTGALLLNLFVVSLQAPGFLHERDKRSHFVGMLVTYMLLFVPFTWGALYTGSFTLRQIELTLLVVLPAVVNAVLGYLAGGTIYYHFKSTFSKTNQTKVD